MAKAKLVQRNPVSLLGAGGKRAPVAAAQKRVQALFNRGYALDRNGRWQKVDIIGQGSRLYGHDLSPSDVEPVPAAVASALNAYVAGKGGIDAVPNNRLLNPKKLTREDFERRYWGKDAHTVPAMTRREFYSDYRESGMAFDKYKKSTSQPYPNPRVHREDPETEAIHERAAQVLGWSLKDVRSHSMPSLREVVRGAGSDPQLVRAMDLWIRSGQGIIPKRKAGSQRIPGRVPQWMLDDQAKYAAEDAAAKAQGLTLQKLQDGTVGYRKNPRPHTYHLPASNFRSGDIGTLESDVGVGFDAQEGQFRTRRRAMVKGKVRSAPAAHLPAGRYVVETPAYMRGHATVKRIKNPPSQDDIRALRDALVANGIDARLTKTGITVSLSHGGKRTARIVPAGYVEASFAILFSNGERGVLRTDGRWSPRDAARSVLDALMSRSMQESQRLDAAHHYTRNPRSAR